jgi:hypothetical protein
VPEKKTAGMSQDNISFMLNTSIKTLLLLCKYLNQDAGNLLKAEDGHDYALTVSF